MRLLKYLLASELLDIPVIKQCLLPELMLPAAKEPASAAVVDDWQVHPELGKKSKPRRTVPAWKTKAL